MKIIKFSLIIISFLLSFSIIGAKAQSINSGLLFTVNHNGDSLDADQGDRICADAEGRCTLRAALQEANANRGNDIIVFALPAPSVIELTLGQLQITSNTSIVGPGARRLTIQRNTDLPDFRIFMVSANAGVNINIHGLKIRNGSAGNEQPGGGIYIEAGNTVNLTDVAVSGNMAKGGGGGIANAGTLNLTRSVINSNGAFQGGAIININGSSIATISNTTITDNSAVDGGAIYNNGNLLLVNNTISHNGATNMASSIVNTSGGTVNVLNTIIGSNYSSMANTLSGAFNSLGNNIITDAQGSSGFTNGVNNDQVSNNNAINPLLGILTDNGGQTDTRALQEGSPAIDKGNNCVRIGSCPSPVPPTIRLSSDQRANYSRLAGSSVDVGAFEAGAGSIIGSATFGARIFSPAKRFTNAIAILTNARTGEKLYSYVNPFGNFRFQNLALGDVYILEIRSKRLGLFSPQIIRFDNIPLGVPFIANIDSENITLLEEK